MKVLILSFFFSLGVLADIPCPKKILRGLEGKVLVCRLSQGLFWDETHSKDDWNLLSVRELKRINTDNHKLVVSVFRLNKNASGEFSYKESYPIYEQGSFGQTLESFFIQGTPVLYHIGDLNEDGVKDFFFAFNDGKSISLIGKTYNEVDLKFDFVGHFSGQKFSISFDGVRSPKILLTPKRIETFHRQGAKRAYQLENKRFVPL